MIIAMKAGNSSNPTEIVKKIGAVTKFTKLQTGEKSSQCSKWRTPPKHFSCLQNILFQKLTLMLGLVTGYLMFWNATRNIFDLSCTPVIKRESHPSILILSKSRDKPLKFTCRHALP